MHNQTPNIQAAFNFELLKFMAGYQILWEQFDTPILMKLKGKCQYSDVQLSLERFALNYSENILGLMWIKIPTLLVVQLGMNWWVL